MQGPLSPESSVYAMEGTPFRLLIFDDAGLITRENVWLDHDAIVREPADWNEQPAGHAQAKGNQR